MMNEPVAVSRRIGAPAADIFRILIDPRKHLELDGSGMLRGAVTEAPVSGVGDVFVMKVYYVAYGDYEMDNHVVEYEPDRRIAWEPAPGRGHPDAAKASAPQGQRWGYRLTPDGPDATIVTETYDCSRASERQRLDLDDGRIWIESMTKTLERLERLCAVSRETAADDPPPNKDA